MTFPSGSHLLLIKLLFLLHPLAFGSWLPRIPEVQKALDLDAQNLAFALAGMPSGILLTLPFAGKLVDKVGPRLILLWLFPLFLFFVTLPVWATNQIYLFIGLMLLGSATSVMELAMNVEADRLEKSDKISIMNMCHGFWSLGMMLGSLIGAGLSQYAVAPQWSMTSLAALSLIPALAVVLLLPNMAPTPETPITAARGRVLWPSPALLGIAFFVFGVTLTEGAIADWSAVFLHDVHFATGASAGAGYGVFAAMMTLMRMRGDVLKQRFNPARLAQVCCVLALAGTLLAACSGHIVTATLGFGLVGIGVAVGFPLAVTASGQLTDRPVASSVAIISFVALIGFLVGPVVIGTTAHYFGMRVGLGILLPALLVSLALAHYLLPSSATNEAPQ